MRGPLVLWDIDNTLMDAGGAGWQLYQQAFRDMFGRELSRAPALAGRTDRAIALDALTLAGVPQPRAQLDAFQRHVAGLAPSLAGRVRAAGRVLPGVIAALAALSGVRPDLGGPDGSGGPDGPGGAGGPGREVVQSVLTGNMRALAEVKLGALGLDRYLDLRVGAYGDAHEIRAELVPLARASAAAAYGADFSGPATVLIGDTPLDVEAARAAGARAVGVATGGAAMADLAEAGADAVLPDLADTARVLAAIFQS